MDSQKAFLFVQKTTVIMTVYLAVFRLHSVCPDLMWINVPLMQHPIKAPHSVRWASMLKLEQMPGYLIEAPVAQLDAPNVNRQ